MYMFVYILELFLYTAMYVSTCTCMYCNNYESFNLLQHVFVIYDKEKIFTYVYYKDTSEG